MAHLKRSVATLRIMGDELVPEEMTCMLGCSPTSARAKGEKLIGKKTGLMRVAQSGIWRLESTDREPEDLDGQIEELLSKLPASLDIWKDISKRFEMDLFCGLFLASGNEGLSISPQSLVALGARGIKLDLDIYGSYDEEHA